MTTPSLRCELVGGPFDGKLVVLPHEPYCTPEGGPLDRVSFPDRTSPVTSVKHHYNRRGFDEDRQRWLYEYVGTQWRF